MPRTRPTSGKDIGSGIVSVPIYHNQFLMTSLFVDFPSYNMRMLDQDASTSYEASLNSQLSNKEALIQ